MYRYDSTCVWRSKAPRQSGNEKQRNEEVTTHAFDDRGGGGGLLVLSERLFNSDSSSTVLCFVPWLSAAPLRTNDTLQSWLV